jgi:TRAP-type uncharacterized transport system fused permease subunit
MDQKKISSFEELKIIEEKYDPQLSFRNIGPKLEIFITIILVTMSLYHFWASGFGLVREVLHRGIHISYVLALVFLVFGWNKNNNKNNNKNFFFLLQIIYLLF